MLLYVAEYPKEEVEKRSRRAHSEGFATTRVLTLAFCSRGVQQHNHCQYIRTEALSRRRGQEEEAGCRWTTMDGATGADVEV